MHWLVQTGGCTCRAELLTCIEQDTDQSQRVSRQERYPAVNIVHKLKSYRQRMQTLLLSEDCNQGSHQIMHVTSNAMVPLQVQKTSPSRCNGTTDIVDWVAAKMICVQADMQITVHHLCAERKDSLYCLPTQPSGQCFLRLTAECAETVVSEYAAGCIRQQQPADG